MGGWTKLDEAGRAWTDVEPQGLTVALWGDEKPGNGHLFSPVPFFAFRLFVEKGVAGVLAPATLG